MRMSLGSLQARPAIRLFTRINDWSPRIQGRTLGLSHRVQVGGSSDGAQGVASTSSLLLKHDATHGSLRENPDGPEEDDSTRALLFASRSQRLRQKPARSLPPTHTKPHEAFALASDAASIRHQEHMVEEIKDDPLEWLLILRARRNSGDHVGMMDTLKRIEDLGHDLPTMGQVANDIWNTLLEVPNLHEWIFDYAVDLRRRTARQSPLIYEGIVGDRLLRLDKSALTWHQRIRTSSLRIPPDILAVLAPIAASSTKSLRLFMHLYKDLHQSNSPFYDDLIPLLVKKGWIKAATEWDRIMIENEDYPSSKLSRQPYMQEFQAKKLEWIARNEVTSKAPQQTLDDLRLRTDLSSSKQGFFSTLVSELQTQPRTLSSNTLSDEFVARLFATKALTITWIVACLQAFSLKRIGPLTLREIATRSGSASALDGSIEDLRHAGISIGSSKFSRAAAQFARDGEDGLLRGLLDSDQHPENLEDDRLQKKLLNQLLDSGRQEDAHLQLVLLSMFKQHPNEEYSNLLLRYHIFRKDVPKVMSVVGNMHAKGLRITTKTLASAGTSLLRPRRAGRLPEQIASGYPEHDLRIVTNLMFHGLQSGSMIPTTLWVELFKRHGMANTFEQLAQFCHITLDMHRSSTNTANHAMTPASWKKVKIGDYRPNDYGDIHHNIALRPQILEAEAMTDKTDQSTNAIDMDLDPLAALFTEKRIQYIIAWGFKEGFHRLQRVRHIHEQSQQQQEGVACNTRSKHHMWPSGVTPPPLDETYLLGLKLVQQLYDKGVQVPGPSKLREVICDRLWMLYGPRRSRRAVNVASRALNPYGILDFVDAVGRIWKGQGLFPSVRRHLQYAQGNDLLAQNAMNFSNEQPTSSKGQGMFLSSSVSPEELQIRRYSLAVLRLLKPHRGASIDRSQYTKASPAEQSLLAYRWANRQALRGLRSSAERSFPTPQPEPRDAVSLHGRTSRTRWNMKREIGLRRARASKSYERIKS